MDAFSNYIREQMKSKVVEFHALSDINVDVSLVQYFKCIQTNMAHTCIARLSDELLYLDLFFFIKSLNWGLPNKGI